MKILLFARDFAPDVGGVQNMLAQLSKTVAPQSLLVLTRKTPGWRDYDAKSPYRIIRFSSGGSLPSPLSKLLRIFLSLVYVPWLVFTWKPDVMFCGYAKTNAPFGWLMKKFTGLPYVVFAYGTDVVRYGEKSGKLIRKWLINADLVATISAPVHKFLETFTNGRGKIVTIPLGCGVSGNAPDSKLTNWRGFDYQGKKLLLTVCRLTPRKGVDKTIEAVALLAEKHTNLVYVVVGGGEDLLRLQKIAEERNIADRVQFAGRVPDEILLGFYDRADIFILASREQGGDIEGFGLVFVEAGAFGVPVIGGDSGGIRQAVGHQENGLLVNSTDPNAIADAVDRLLTDRALSEKLGAEGKARAEVVYTWENSKKTLCEALIAQNPCLKDIQ